MPTEGIVYGVDDYVRRLDVLTTDDRFYTLPQLERGAILAEFRNKYSANIEDPETLNVISALTKVKSDFTKGDRYKITPEVVEKVGLTPPAIHGLDKREALKNIDAFRKLIDEKSVDFDPIFREDYVFDLNRMAYAAEREARGQKTGILSDKVDRVAQGMTGGIFRLFRQTELADQFETKFFPENPGFDGDFLSTVASPFRTWATSEEIVGKSRGAPATQLTSVESTLANGLVAAILIAIVYVSFVLRSKAISGNAMAALAAQKMGTHPTHSGGTRIAAAFFDLAIAALLAMQVEKMLLPINGSGGAIETIVAVSFGFLYLSCKDCFGGMSIGKRIFGCMLADKTAHGPIAPIDAFKRNGRLYVTAAAIFALACILGAAAGEMVGAIFGIVAMIVLFIRFAIRSGSTDGDLVLRRSSVDILDLNGSSLN